MRKSPAASEAENSDRAIALVHMPWANPNTAPIQVGLLKSVVTEAGFQADTVCANLDLLEFIDIDTYLSIAETQLPLILGEWLFAKDIYDKDTKYSNCSSDTAYLKHLLAREQITAKQFDFFQEFRVETAIKYLDFLINSYPWNRYELIGFSCVFSQALPSLALARRIKELYPSISIVFGGAQCSSPMGEEYLRAFPWLDYVCVGPGEIPLKTLLECSNPMNPEIEIAGIAKKQFGVVETPKNSMEMPLNEIPFADYSTYFSRAEESNLDGRVALEASRGCWWGQLHHCTFCGISSDIMPFRSKTATRVFEEMQHHSSQHGVLDFVFTDYIMDHRYFKEFLPLLENSGLGQHCFFETKSNLTRPRLESLVNAGIQTIQPGVESFSTNVLKIMNKGATALQNIQLLRYCKELGILPLYNILYGFPGETKGDYIEQTALIEKLEHLQPPVMCGSIVIHRYSPLFNGTAPHNYRDITPRDDYFFVFDPNSVDINQIAYEHKGVQYSDDPELYLAHKNLEKKIGDWRSNTKAFPSRLEFRLGSEFMRIEDTRNGNHKIHQLDQFGRDCYLFFWKKASTVDSFDQCMQNSHKRIDTMRVAELIQQLVEADLIVEENRRYLSIATPHSTHLRSRQYSLDVE